MSFALAWHHWILHALWSLLGAMILDLGSEFAWRHECFCSLLWMLRGGVRHELQGLVGTWAEIQIFKTCHGLELNML